MTRAQKRTAAFLTAALMTTGTAGHFPALPGKVAAPDTVLSFAGELEAAGALSHGNAAFSELRYSDAEQQFYQDGRAVGREWQGFRVIGGELMVDEAITLTAAEQAANASDAESYIPLSEAKDRIGLDVFGNGGNTVIAAPFQTGTLIVKADTAVDPHGAVQITEGYGDLHVLQYETAADAYAAYQAFEADDSIAFAEPNRIVHAAEMISGDISYDDADFWGRKAVGADVFLTHLNLRTEPANEIKVAVIDSGLYAEHKWFEGRIAEGGTSFVAENSGSYEDLNSHGTHCAGIVCSVTNDNVKILPVKVLGEDGSGSSLCVYLGMIYAAEQNADVVSMSLGGIGVSPLMEEGARVLREAGIPTVAAAGNETMDVCYSTPANVDSVIAISSVSKGMNSEFESEYFLSGYSNFGEGIDFAAPGQNINSAGISGPDAMTVKSGTSMATPYAAGCIADLLDYDNTLTTDEIYELLRINAADLGEAGFDTSFGWGMVNLRDFVSAAADSDIAPPAASVPDGTYTDVFSVTLETETADAEIYYTLDGTFPAAEIGIRYDGTPIEITKTTELRAIAVKDGKSSLQMRAEYRVECEMPQASVMPGEYADALTVTLSASEHAKIYYTTDGTVPSADVGTLYGGEEIAVAETTVIQAVAVIGETESKLLTAAYIIEDTGYDALFRIEDGVLTAYYGTLSVITAEMFPQDQPFTEIGAYAFAECDALESVSLPDSVIVIGDYAFYQCRAFSAGRLDLQIDWTRVTSIGEHAFAESGITGDLPLTNLAHLGAYAFADTENLKGRVTLSDAVTVLPDGVFNNSALSALTAEGVTEIGASALSSEYYASGSQRQQINIHWDAVTAIGRLGIAGLNLNGCGDISFDALTEIGAYAFYHTKAACLSFPALKNIPTEAFAEPQVSMLYFEAVETIAQHAFTSRFEAYDFGVVVGDALHTAASNACLSIEGYRMILAGPADSPLQSCAYASGLPYYTTPDIYVPYTEFDVSQYETPLLRAYPLAFDAQIHWVLADANGTAQDTAIYTEPQYRLIPDTGAAGTYIYYAVMEQTEQSDVYSEPIMLEIKDTADAGTVTSSEWYGIIDWSALYPADSSEQSAAYTFTPAHDGLYYIYGANGNETVSVLTETERFEQTGSGDKPDNLTGIALKAGETVRIVLHSRWEQYSCLYVTESKRRESLAWADYDLPQERIADTGEIVLPEVEITVKEYGDDGARTRTLQQDVDYVLAVSYKERGADRWAYAFGIGDYSGVLGIFYHVYQADYTLETDMPFESTAEYGFTEFRIQPEKTGMHAVYLDFTDEDYEAIENGDVSAMKRVAGFILLDANGSIIRRGEELKLSKLAFLMYNFKAGETYYLRISAPTDQTLLLRSTTETWSKSLMISYSDLPDEIPYTGSIVEPEFSLYSRNDTLLTEGVDYTLQYLHSNPDYLTVLIRGMGDYYGTAYRLIPILPQFEHPDTELIFPDEAFECTEQYAVYELYLSENADLIFRTDDGKTDPFTASFYQYDWQWECTDVFTEQTVSDVLSLTAGSYYLVMQQPEAQTRSCIFETVTRYPALWNAEAEIGQLIWTGQPLDPVFDLYYNGELLQKGIDYVVMPYGPIIDCGLYAITLYGIGAYSGTYDLLLTVVPDIANAELTLQEGVNTVQIGEAGTSQLFKWIPTGEDACIWKSDTRLEQVIIYDANGEVTDFFEEPGYAEITVQVYPGKTYYVYAAYCNDNQTGSFDLVLTYDFTALSDCTVDSLGQLLWQPDGNLPAYRILDGDTVLTEGADYELLAHGAEFAPGHAQMTFIGHGHYVGWLDFDYYFYQDFSDLDASTLSESYPLSLNEPETWNRSYPGTAQLFTFAAETAGTYYLQLPNAEYGGVSAFVYDQNEQILPMDTAFLTLDAGETVQILCITDWLESDYEITDCYEILVSDSAPLIWYETDGYTYMIENGEAFLVDFPYEMTGLTIPDVIYDEADGVTAVFAGISNGIKWLVSTYYTIYGENGGLVDEYCHANGFCFAGIDPDCTVRGDITGDGVLNHDDTRTLLRWLSECSGMRLSEQAYAAADLDGDGIVTLLDLAVMLAEIPAGSAVPTAVK